MRWPRPPFRGVLKPSGSTPLNTTAPSTPTGLLAATAAPGQIDLAWTASTDNNVVAGYNVYRDGTKIATTYSTGYSDLGLDAGTPHTYTVAAFDGAANTSDPSSGATASAALARPSSVSYAYDLADRLTRATHPAHAVALSGPDAGVRPGYPGPV